MQFRLRRIVALLAAVLAVSALAVTSASATTTWVKNANYQFASNYTAGSSTPFVVSNNPFSLATSNQKLAANGVDLSVSGSPAYASSAIIAPLGRLSTMFDSGGKFVPPAIVGGGNLVYNLYFDVNGDQTYFNWHQQNPYTFMNENGDSAASMGAVNNTADQANFTTFASEPDNGNAAVGLSGVMTMEAVKAAFAANDKANPNPLVWAWIGIQTTPNQAGFITSVDGVKQVKGITTNLAAPTGLRSAPRFIRALLSWHAVPGAAGLAYRVQVFEGRRLVFDKLTTRTSIWVGGLRERTLYRWHVGVNGFRWSGFQLFRTR